MPDSPGRWKRCTSPGHTEPTSAEAARQGHANLPKTITIRRTNIHGKTSETSTTGNRSQEKRENFITGNSPKHLSYETLRKRNKHPSRETVHKRSKLPWRQNVRRRNMFHDELCTPRTDQIDHLHYLHIYPNLPLWEGLYELGRTRDRLSANFATRHAIFWVMTSNFGTWFGTNS